MKKITAFFLQAFLFTSIIAQNVGIGTTTPITKLHVRGIESNIATFAGGTAMYITLTEDGIERGYIGSYSGNPEDVDFGTFNNSPGKLHLVTGTNIPRLTVMANGNVGIGTTTPEQLFSVAGGMLIDQNNLNTGTAANILRFGSSSGEGIGSKRNAGTNQWGLDFYTQNIRRMTIANNGNVGIGTVNPQALLDVNGDLNIENRLMLNNSAGTAGQALVSNGTGMAPSWRNTSYSNNDRFLFRSLSSGVNDTLTFSTVYSHSSAITYNNGVFTINKTGLYELEGFFSPFFYTPAAEDVIATVQLQSNTILTLAFDALPYAGFVAGSPFYTKTISATIKLYFTAGSTFFLQGSVGGTVAGSQQGFLSGYPLCINLVAE